MRPAVRALLEAAFVHGLLGWLYAAAVAAFRPDSLSQHIASVLPVRRDTFGACCFVVSAAAAFALQARGEWALFGGRRTPRPGAVDAALRTLTGYALLVWGYLCVNSLTHPETLERRLTHFLPVPTEGTTADVAFTLSGAALFALRLRGGRRAARG
jgi:hypothetical protein